MPEDNSTSRLKRRKTGDESPAAQTARPLPPPAAPVATLDDEPGPIGKSIGRFKVTARLPKSGHCVAFEGLDADLVNQPKVALKVLPPAETRLDPAIAEVTFIETGKEIRAALDHPHIARLLTTEWIDEEESPNLGGIQRVAVWEFVKGEPLSELIAHRSNGLSPDDAQRIFTEILDAVAFAHDQGIAHGHLRAENVLVTPDKGVKVMDFGLFRLTGKPTDFLPHFPVSRLIPPASDFQRDVFHLALLLYRMVTGVPAPFAPGDAGSAVPDPRDANPKVSERIAEAILRATANVPAQRLKTVAELRNILTPQQPLPDLPVMPAPEERGRTLTLPVVTGAKSVTPAAAVAPLSEAARPVGFVDNLVEGAATAMQALAGSEEKPAGQGFRLALGFVFFLVTAILGLSAYRALSKGTPEVATVGTVTGPVKTRRTMPGPTAEALPPAADISAELPPLVPVAGGTFDMGDTTGKPDETPVHRVTVGDFEMGKYEVTNAQYKAFCDATRRSYPDDVGMPGMTDYFRAYPTYPVVRVSWADAKAYCAWLSLKTGDLYRLPTEAEWEYAARDSTVGWDNLRSGGQPHEVGTSAPNPRGLHDMFGNVWEWCEDWYGPYDAAAQTNPRGPVRGTHKVLRGCSWYYSTEACSAAARFRFEPDLGYWFNGGFRVVKAKR